jgi:hypothetical protein
MIEIKRASAHEFKLDEQGAVTVAFAQLDVVDRDGDVTFPGAFPSKSVPMSAYGHTSWGGELPPGRGAIEEAGGWAVFKGQFLMETDHGRNTYHTVKAMDELQEWSYGYDAVDYSYGTRDNRAVRFLKALDVFEVSPVLVGAGLGTHTMTIKSGSAGPVLPYADHLEAFLKDWAVLSDRSRDRAEFRAKEGRALSTATRDRLAQLLEAWEKGATNLRTLLADTEPAKARTDREIAATVEFLRFNGVPLG